MNRSRSSRLAAALALALTGSVSTPAFAQYEPDSEQPTIQQTPQQPIGEDQQAGQEQSGTQVPTAPVPEDEEAVPQPQAQLPQQQQGEQQAGATPTTDQRRQMADVHENFAECLRSNRSFDECRQEMRQGCQAMGPNGCPMMGPGHGHGHGMGMGGSAGGVPKAPKQGSS